MKMFYIKLLKSRSDEELLSQLPFKPTTQFIEFVKYRMAGMCDGVYVCFPTTALVNGALRKMSQWELGWMYHYSNKSPNYEHDGLGYFKGQADYSYLAPLPMVTPLVKFEKKAQELGYVKIGNKKYAHPNGHKIAYKEQYKDGGTKAMWLEAIISGCTVVYSGEGAQKIADRLSKVHINMFTKLETFLDKGIAHGE